VCPVKTVIATGGSVVYSEKAMQHLADIATIVYLKAGKDEIVRRLRNIKERGVVLKDGEDFDEMFDERIILYEKYADMIIEEGQASIEETIAKIQEKM
jgi:shikimate kinase